MAVAPHAMAWQRRMANLPGPLSASVTPLGVPFLTDELGPDARLAVLIGFGADPSTDPTGWPMTDVSADVLQADPVRIVPGRADEQSQTQPARAELTLINTTGDYTPRRATSRYWPYVHQGIPLRVTVNSGASGLVDRFTGTIDGLYPSWDSTGNYAVVKVTAKGILNRFTQGSQALRSPLTRAILAAGPRQYWPVEDGINATQAASAINGGPPLTVDGTVRFSSLDPLNFGTASSISLSPGTTFGFENPPQMKEGGALRGSFPPGSASAWSVQAMVFNARNSADLAVSTIYSILQWTTTDGAVWRLYVDPVTTNTTYVTYNGSNVVNVSGGWVFEELRVDAVQSGSNIQVTITRAGVSSATASFAGTLTGVNSVALSPDKQVLHDDWSVSQVRIWDGVSEPDFKSADLISGFWGYPGEGCWTRFLRLCREEGIPAAISTGATSGGRAMGPQKTSTLIALLRECEAADGGVMADG